MEVKPKAKAKASSARKKLLEDIGDKSIEEVMEEQKRIRAQAEATIAEATALEQAQAAQVAEALKEYEKASSEVEAMIIKEQEAAKAYNDIRKSKEDRQKKAEDATKRLLEARKKVTTLEVHAVNHRKMMELEEKRKAATAAAEAAKRNLAEQRQREKDALEATRKALEEARQKAKEAKGIGRGLARKSAAPGAEEPDAKKSRTEAEAETLPATLPAEGEDLE